MRRMAIIIGTSLLLASGCSRDLSSGAYGEAQTGEADSTYEGVIVSMRTIQVKPDTGENAGGTLAGGALGAAGGSAIGRGTGSLVSAIGGAIVGAVAGNVVEGELRKQTAMEYIVKLVNTGTIKKRKGHRGGESEESETTNEQESDIRTVVQAADPALKVHSKVYVIVSKKGRSRIVPRG